MSPTMDAESCRSKRRSVHGNQDVYAASISSVERRSSKKSSSQDRHGKVYPDSFPKSTIRSVTPETESKQEIGSENEAPETPSATSPSSQSIPSGHVQERTQQYASSVRTTDSDRSSADVKRKQIRTKTKPSEQAGSEQASSPSLFSKTRTRLGSITTSSPFSPKSEDQTGSIGFPSIQSPPLSISTEQRSKLVKTRPAVLSPSSNPPPSEPPLRSPTSDSDSKKILTLMNTTSGRMHGILSFRPSTASTWTTGYCAINVASGSLICQVKGEVTSAKTLIPDLRGCSVRTFIEADSGNNCLNVTTASSRLGMHLKPQVPETFDSWLAALLCWQPFRPKGLQNKMAKPQSTAMVDRKDRRRVSESSAQRNAAIIKVGKMLLWETYPGTNTATVSSSIRRGSAFRFQPALSTNWQRVSCTLHENGHFKLLTESDAQPIHFIQLSQLSRCAVQQLDASVLGEEFCIALYPQYTVVSASQVQPNPMFLRLESRVLFEVWFVLLRAFTVPELYGPQQSLGPEEDTASEAQSIGNTAAASGMFRVERTLCLKITEAAMTGPPSSPIGKRPARTEIESLAGDYYAETCLDGEVRGRTATKSNTTKPFWREEFTFTDLPPVLSSASVLIKAKNSAEKEWTMVAKGDYSLNTEGLPSAALNSNNGDIEVAMHDPNSGKVELMLDDLETGKDIDQRWPVLDPNNQQVGELLMKVRLDETIVLMTEDYTSMSTLLHTFSNNLTVRIGQELNADLRQVSEILLDIFQVSTRVSEWIMILVEDEIDGSYRDNAANRLRYSGRMYSNESYEAGPERELVVRDLGKTAATEANLLFRGNTLLTRAFDAHMRRLGKEYLVETIGERLKEIDEGNIDCEVDPNRVTNPHEQSRNWRTLISLTTSMWKAISSSATRCPSELRLLLRHVRSCAEDRYGDFMRSVSYSSVSGFLFLRLFCPAILNPKLFGLLKNHPQPQANRTLTLIAKSLQTLANMTQFGGKEPWMEPMNKFLNSARSEFKSFVDEVCSISTEKSTQNVSPSYATPIQILGRLPSTSREGFPSLPFLIDSPKNFAALIDLWLSRISEEEVIDPLSNDDPLRLFHEQCKELQERTDKCLADAEQAERPTEGLQSQWEHILEERERSKTFYDESNSTSKPSTPLGDAPTGSPSFHSKAPRDMSAPFARAFSPQASSELQEESEDTPPSSASFTWDQSRVPFSNQTQEAETRVSTSSSKNSSTISLNPAENGRARPRPPSREGSGGKIRLLDFASRSRRKQKGRDGSTTPREEYRNEF